MQTISTIATCGLLLALGSTPARAGLMSIQTASFNPSGANNNVTNGHVVTVFSVTPTFNQFDPALGTLTAARLQWNATGSLTVFGNNEGIATMSYATSSDTESWNIYGGSTVLNFSISGSTLLDLTTVTGTGKVSDGAFKETYQLQQGFFPAQFSTGPTNGTITLEYDYYVGSAIQDAPEPSTFGYVLTGLALVALGRYHGSPKNQSRVLWTSRAIDSSGFSFAILSSATHATDRDSSLTTSGAFGSASSKNRTS